jgi:hypothetical protein
MRTFKKVAIALAAVTIMAGPSMGAQILFGGNVPLVNTMVGIGVLSLDLSGPATLVQVASFIINNNSTSFVATMSFTNGGYLIPGTVTNPAIPLTDIKFIDGGLGTFGTAIPPTALPADLTPILKGTPITATITSGTQSTSTINDEVLVQASYADPSAFLAGLYTEQIVFGIVATM